MKSIAWITLLAGIAATATASPLVHVINTNTNIDLVNANTNVGPTINTSGISSTSLAITPTGTLIAADANGGLWNVNGPPIPAGGTGMLNIADLDYANNGLYGFSNATNELFFFDFGSNAVTYSQVISIPSALTFTGVAHEPSTGRVYLSAHNSAYNDFLMYVPSMGVAAVPVGAMTHGDAFSYISDVDFDASGNLMAMTWFHRHFYGVNTATAATTFTSAGPHRDATGMALNPVPEPATMGALALGLAAFFRRRRSSTRYQ